jgi:hypothetical protein
LNDLALHGTQTQLAGAKNVVVAFVQATPVDGDGALVVLLMPPQGQARFSMSN